MFDFKSIDVFIWFILEKVLAIEFDECFVFVCDFVNVMCVLFEKVCLYYDLMILGVMVWCWKKFWS